MFAELLSGVDYRETACYPSPVPSTSTALGVGTIDQVQQQQLATTSTASASVPSAPVPQPPLTPPPSPPAAPGEVIFRGIQSPFAGLAKLLNQYNLFG